MTTFELLSLIGGAIVTIVGAIWFLFECVFKLGKTSEHLESFEKKTIDAFDKIDKRLDKIDEMSEEHTLALVEIFTFLGQKYPKRGKLFSQKQSPRVLNSMGLEIFEKIDGQKFLEENKEVLFERIDSYEPNTRLDVEQQAFNALVALSTDSIFNRLKDYVYDAPAITTPDGSYELTIGDICFILSIPLRDMYIKEKGIE